MLTAEQILAAIKLKVNHPATVRELMQRLKLSREQRVTLRRRLATLVESGALIKVRGNRYGLPDRMQLVTGRVIVNPRGFGFVTPDQPVVGLDGDLYIAGANLNQAMHGDRVVARVEHQRSEGRAEGRIVRILERATDQLVGRLETDESGMAYVVPFDRRLVMDVHIPKEEGGEAEAGQLVVVALTRFPTSTRGPVGRVTEVLGNLDTPGLDTELVIRKFGIPDDHPRAAVAEAEKLGSHVRPRDIKGRQDFRARQTVTIDGETARDFDDAITLEKLPNGHFWLGVHIADVSHYVPAGSALDVAAYERATSVYFPDRAVHMFPEELSTGLCSLNPDVDRLVQSCLMEIDARGTVCRYEIHDGVIHSDARMTYTDVNAILVDRDPETRVRYESLLPMFELMNELFVALNARRRGRGSIDFDLPAAEFLMDDEGRVEAIVAAERNQAHRIIEECMLIANETVAGHLEKQGIPSLFRVHESPDPLKIAEFEDFTASLGYSLGAPSEGVAPRHFQRLLQRLRGEPEERPVAFLMLRTMQQARYDVQNRGHFGLAAPSYTHFTSPIRRYPDLVVHRALRETQAAARRAPSRAAHSEALPEVARHTSEMERRAEDAEREVVQWKKVRFMVDKVGDEFTGYVTGVTAFGLFIELVEHFVEGLVHISSMADDYYTFFERQHELRGENRRKVYRLGDVVKVQLVRVDRDHRKLELALMEVLEWVRRRDAQPRPRKNTGRPKRDKRPRRR
jgi:ribonuclease R